MTKKRRKRLIIQISFCIFLFASFIGVLSFFSHTAGLAIDQIEVGGNTLVSSAEVANLVKREIAGNYLGLFSKANVLIFPRSAIRDLLLEKFKRIKTVRVSMLSFQSIAINIVERQPVALWCRSDDNKPPAPGLVSASKDVCYFLDDSGLIFAEAPVFSGNAYFRYYGENASSSASFVGDMKNPVGYQYMSEERFQELGYFIKSLGDIGVKASSFYSQPDGDYQVTIDKGVRLFLSQDISFAESLNNLNSLLNDPTLNAKSHSLLDSVDYIDLRYGNKVYFKPKT